MSLSIYKLKLSFTSAIVKILIGKFTKSSNHQLYAKKPDNSQPVKKWESLNNFLDHTSFLFTEFNREKTGWIL